MYKQHVRYHCFAKTQKRDFFCYIKKLFIAVTLLVLVLPSSIVLSIDTTPPQFSSTPSFSPLLYVGLLSNALLYAYCYVTDNIAIADVRLVIIGPDGFTYNESMTNIPYCEGSLRPLPAYGTYYLHLWAVDSSGNAATTSTYESLILENYVSYVHVDDNAVFPYDGSSAHPFPTIAHGVLAVSTNGTVYVHPGMYRERVSMGSMNLIGEDEDTVIIDASGGDYGVRIYSPSTAVTSTISHVTVRNSSNNCVLLETAAASHIILSYNNIYDNTRGVNLPTNTPIILMNCDIANNTVGIQFSSGGTQVAQNKTIIGCNIHHNTIGLKAVTRFSNNTIYHNNFYNNTHHEQLASWSYYSNQWDDGTTGNYWDDYQQRYPNANINHTTGTWGTPYKINTTNQYNYDNHPWVSLNGYINSAPATPNAPIGQSTGIARIQYSYSAVTTDPDSSQVYYWFDWGDGTNSGWVGPFSSGTTGTASHQWDSGEYQVKVKAKDAEGQESAWSSSLSVFIANQSAQETLHVTAPTSVIENREFQVTVIASSGEPVSDVRVTFAGETGLTDAAGLVRFMSPDVTKNVGYQIIASHSDYASASLTIIVLNQLEDAQGGWIYGMVYDEATSAPLNAAEVTASFSSQENKAVFTDNDGRYVLLLPTGTYDIIITKNGYYSSTITGVVITANSAQEQNIPLLQKTQDAPSATTRDDRIIEYTISEKTSDGVIGGRINLGTDGPLITYYSEGLTVELDSTEEHIVINVTGQGSTGTILVIRIGDGVLSDLDNVTLTYDGTLLTEIQDVANFFRTQEQTTASWLRFQTITGLYIFIRVPHFSTHTITISSVGTIIRDALSSTTAVAFFLSASIIAVVLFIVPIYVMYFRKQKR